MKRIKFLELRDAATFIPAVAIDCSLSGNAYDDYLLKRAGYGAKRCILLTALHGGPAHYDPYDWGGNTTWQIAHDYITDHWDEITDAQVICVETILGKRSQPKRSERYDDPEWRDAVLYRMVDEFISAGMYRAEDREQHFALLKQAEDQANQQGG